MRWPTRSASRAACTRATGRTWRRWARSTSSSTPPPPAASRRASALPFGIATPRTLAVDLSYGEAAIPFLAWARGAHCAQAIDGLGMLVEQAAESFQIWHGVRPATDAIYAELRASRRGLSTGD